MYAALSIVIVIGVIVVFSVAVFTPPSGGRRAYRR